MGGGGGGVPHPIIIIIIINFLSLLLPIIKQPRKPIQMHTKALFFFNGSNHIHDNDDNDIIGSKPHLMN